jgi:hypothetical protein
MQKEIKMENILENNKLIANFLLGESTNEYVYEYDKFYMPYLNSGEWFNDNELLFHSSWDWLMQVVTRCLSIDEPEEGQHFFINESLITTDIEVVYDRVIEFIKLHNESRIITIYKDKTLQVLKSAFDALDYISDTCDDEQQSPSECLSQIRLTANGELAELEELIIELQKK